MTKDEAAIKLADKYWQKFDYTGEGPINEEWQTCHDCALKGWTQGQEEMMKLALEKAYYATTALSNVQYLVIKLSDLEAIKLEGEK